MPADGDIIRDENIFRALAANAVRRSDALDRR